jgi:pyruvate/2-oxoglutarate dehydrogenase complex dihydrolipoamide acyltransferase (E2) component
MGQRRPRGAPGARRRRAARCDEAAAAAGAGAQQRLLAPACPRCSLHSADSPEPRPHRLTLLRPRAPGPPSRAPKVRVQGLDREDMGVLATDEARQIAREEGVDLVMISPDASPPVCRLIEFGKYKYEQERATKQRQKASKGCAAAVSEPPAGPAGAGRGRGPTEHQAATVGVVAAAAGPPTVSPYRRRPTPALPLRALLPRLLLSLQRLQHCGGHPPSPRPAPPLRQT